MIRDVWQTNLEMEMRNIRGIIERYPYVAMDTEFPGVVARPIGSFKTSSDYHYQTMRCNVELLKLIQIGITLADEDGNYPQDVSTWQFNFRFSVNDDMYAPDSIELLQKSGIDFQRHEEFGILPNDFAELLITSGLVLSDTTKWISFHSGYDFGYLVKLLTNACLPNDEKEFFELLHIWFPSIYDVKFIMRACKPLKGGLQDVADDLGVRDVMRIGSSQAGSDSLLTSATFFKMREIYFADNLDDDQFNGTLYGLGSSYANGNLLSEPDRAGATAAERDRGPSQSAQQQQQGMGGPPGLGGGLPTPGLGGGFPTPLATPFAPGMGGNPFVRNAMGTVGGDR